MTHASRQTPATLSSASSPAAPRGDEPTRAVLVGVEIHGDPGFDPALEELGLLAASVLSAAEKFTARPGTMVEIACL